jgi:hypothetical protein
VTGYSIKRINNYDKNYVIIDNEEPLSRRIEEKVFKKHQEVVKDY